MIKPNHPQTVLIVGLAREGLAAARWLTQQDGVHVIASDLRPPAANVQERLQDLGVQLAIGPQTPNLLDNVHAVVVSPGVPQAIPLLQAARAKNLHITTEPRLFAQGNPAPLIGITGSSGKTTTTTLVARILEGTGYLTWLGGNIGSPLLPQIAGILPQDRAVMELSSFQLLYWQATAPWPHAPVAWIHPNAISPKIAAILNITPNHLDRHPSMAHYTAAKANIAAAQKPGDTLVLNRDDPILEAWARFGQVHIPAGPGQEAITFPIKAKIITFGFSKTNQPGSTWLKDRHISLQRGGKTQTIIDISDIQLRGRHNLANVLAAVAIANATGASRLAMKEAIHAFRGVQHRMEEIIHTRKNILWINDSIATAPERAIAAMRSFDAPIILLAGGRDKALPWQEWAKVVQRRARIVIAFGEAAPIIEKALQNRPPNSRLNALYRVKDLPAAVQQAYQLARSNEIVLLSPGGTSYDAYVDFAARGNHFRQLVKELYK
jgi:UDP-N-acetylmuramoylalanine--D-glutamate ligase